MFDHDHLLLQLSLDFSWFQGEEWGGLYEDDLALPEPEEEPQESDSDFEFDGTRIKKTKSKKFAKAKATKLSAPTAKASTLTLSSFTTLCRRSEAVFREKHGVLDPRLELSFTSLYLVP
jgi:hypothetical protein